MLTHAFTRPLKPSWVRTYQEPHPPGITLARLEAIREARLRAAQLAAERC